MGTAASTGPTLLTSRCWCGLEALPQRDRCPGRTRGGPQSRVRLVETLSVCVFGLGMSPTQVQALDEVGRDVTEPVNVLDLGRARKRRAAYWSVCWTWAHRWGHRDRERVG